jgi:selenocysteine-specific elongation factor
MEMESKLMVHGNQIGVKEKERVQEIFNRKDVGLVQEAFSKESLTVLSIHSLLDEVSFDTVIAEEIIRFLLKQKMIVEIGDGLYTKPEALKMAYEKMRNYLDSNPTISAAQLRDLLETGRKIAILYLEYFDEKQITIRQGNDRVKGARYDELEEGTDI